VAGIPPVAAPTLPLDGVLLDARLSIPLPRPGLVSRADLVSEARSSACRIVAVSAPPGYGKSSLLTEWVAAEDRPVAWVALDRFDDDPVRLLTLLASAFVRGTGAPQSLVDDMRVHSVAALGRAAPRLASALRSTRQPFVFVIDDVHSLASPACQDVLSVVISGIPDGSQFVSASRSTQPHVPSLRASDDVLEIGSAELALDAAGAMQIFQSAHVEVTPELAARVTERTEGWPVGLHLAALIARSTGDAASVIYGNDRFVADYLYRESFASFSEVTQEFLRRTAVLEHLSDELCRAVTGDTLSGARLRELERDNAFLIPQDRTRAWYRYHGLYREFLLSELRRVEPALVPELHARAAQWYEASDSPAMAIEHLLQMPNDDHVVKLIDTLGLSIYQMGDMATLRRWLSTLGESVIMEYPPLGVLSGWIAALSGDIVDADRWAAILESASFDDAPMDGSASFASSWAMLRAMMCPAGPEQMMVDAQFALAEEPAWSVWRDQALYLAGEAELLFDDIDRADAHFAEAAVRATAMGNADVMILASSHRAMICMTSGGWDRATDLVEFALSTIKEHHLEDYSTSVLAYAMAARLALHSGDVKAATSQLTRAMRARPVCTYVIPTLSVRARVHLAMAYWSLGDARTARYLLLEIEDILLNRPALGALLSQFATLKKLVIETASGAQGGPPLTPAELRLLPYLQTHLTIPEIAARLFVSRNTVSTEVGSIYRKLGVSSRGGAVERATAIGLLG
jgi:LuxR family maltose regulon positive regulatory protein